MTKEEKLKLIDIRFGLLDLIGHTANHLLIHKEIREIDKLVADLLFEAELSKPNEVR